MSRHNVYPEFGDQVVERWQKACIHPIAGTRIDPYRDGSKITFILRSKESNYNFETRVITFSYDDDIVELYTPREVMVFRALNKAAIESGLLVPYGESKQAIDTRNALTDEQVKALAEIPQLPKFKKALGEITAITTLRRIASHVPESRAKAFDRAVIDRMAELDGSL
jgi:hypothetical protein